MKKVSTISAILFFCFALSAQKTELVIPAYHTGPLKVLKISADGKTLISGGNDQVLKIWDFQKGKEIKGFSTGDEIAEAQFSPDGKYVIATDKKQVYIIDLEKIVLHKKIKMPYRAMVYGLVFHPNSQSFYFTFNNDAKKQVEIHRQNIDGSNDQVIFSRPADKSYENFYSLSISPNGNYLVGTTRSLGTFLINTNNPQDYKMIPGAQFFLPNGYLLKQNPQQKNQLTAVDPASGAQKWQSTFRWLPPSVGNFQTYEEFFIDPVHKKLSYSRANGTQETLLVIDYTTGKSTEKRLFMPEEKLIQIAQIGDDWLLRTENKMELRKAGTKELKKQFGQALISVAYLETNHNEASLVAGGYFNKEVKYFNLLEERINTLTTEKGNPLIRISSNGKTVATADNYNYNGHIEVFHNPMVQSANGKVAPKVKVPYGGNKKKLLDIALSANGQQLAIINFEWLRVINTQTGAMEFEQKMNQEFYKYSGGKLYFSPDDKLLLQFESINGQSSSARKTIRCYSTKSKSLLWAKQYPYAHYQFKDAETLYAIDQIGDKLIRINANTGAEIPGKALKDLAVSIPVYAYNSTWNRYAQPDDFTIDLFNLNSGTQTAKLSGATGLVRDLSFYQQDFLFSCGNDNVIRLWDTKNEIQLAQLIFYEGSNDWVVLSPDGRFDGSQKAISQLYYTKGRTFIPLEQLYEQYYTPNLLRQLLEREIEPVPLEIEDIISPPNVRITYKAGSRNLIVEDDTSEERIETAKEEAQLELIATTEQGTVEEIRLYHNGKIVSSGQRGLIVEDEVAGEKKQRYTLSLLAGENSFRAVAVNHQRTESAPALLKIKYQPASTSTTPSNNSGGIKLHLVVIGINEYKNRKYNLNYAVADALAFKESISAGMQSITTDINVHYVNNSKADKQGILNVMEAVKQNANPQDILIFYYAGHGVMSEGIGDLKKDFYLVPHDVTQLYGADEALAQRGISATEMNELSANIVAQKQLFILDACQSAGAVESIAMRGAAEEKAIAQLARSTGTHWLTASGSEQFATEFAQLGHGVFTYALLEGLKGKADSGDKKVTVNELKAWLESEVPDLTQKHKGTPQYPASYGYGQDFPVGVVPK